MAITYSIHGASHRGQVRERNEDSIGCRLLPDGMVAAVADGVGGRPGGALASQTTTGQILRIVEHDSPGPVADRLLAACRAANAAVRHAQREHPGCRDMATTVIAMLARGSEAALLHAGDSRCYRFRDGRLARLTRDDTVAEQMVADGTITAADAARTPYQHVLTRAIGMDDELACTLAREEVRSGDVYLLCSDGLSNAVSDDEIAVALAETADDGATVDRLIAAANAAGGPDNISVIIIRCLETSS
jgi:serine/threonine protein phosphatase PrpC